MGESGLVVVGKRRRHAGTLWVWELRAPGRGEKEEQERSRKNPEGAEKEGAP